MDKILTVEESLAILRKLNINFNELPIIDRRIEPYGLFAKEATIIFNTNNFKGHFNNLVKLCVELAGTGKYHDIMRVRFYILLNNDMYICDMKKYFSSIKLEDFEKAVELANILEKVVLHKFKNYINNNKDIIFKELSEKLKFFSKKINVDYFKSDFIDDNLFNFPPEE